MSVDIQPTSFDHVALWVDQREPMANFLCEYLGMHVIEETDTFTLVFVMSGCASIIGTIAALGMAPKRSVPFDSLVPSVIRSDIAHRSDSVPYDRREQT